MKGASPDLEIAIGEAARLLSDRPIAISVSDPDGVLGPSPVLEFRRHGRVPQSLHRTLLIRGRGRFFGWTPDDLDAIRLIPCVAARPAGRAPVVRLRQMRLVEIGARIGLASPRALIRLAKLFVAGNSKGVIFRFVRFFEGLSEPSYRDWVWAEGERRKAEARNALSAPPPVTVTITGDAALAALSRESLSQQTYPAIRESDGPPPDGHGFWMRLPAGVRLAPQALEDMVQSLLARSAAAAVYADEDVMERSGRRHSPFFKPAWDQPLAEAGWLKPDAALIRASALPQDVDAVSLTSAALLTRVAARGAILHLPRVLLHRPGLAKPALNTRRPSPVLKPVSVIIPTRDRADLLAACLEGLLNRTRHAGLDILVIDNDSREDATLTLLSRIEAEGHIRRVSMPGAFNFSRACNLGVSEARHEAVLLLNNDVEPLQDGWLAEMLGEMEDPRVGAVGPLLLFPDGYVQHGGVILGHGSIARHSFHFHHPDGGEDRGLLSLRRNLSAVTAACLLTRRSLWQAVGGMNEEMLPVAFNDVDYCLKLRKQGAVIRWTPHARLLHRESVSRGTDNTDAKRKRFAAEEKYMFETWGSLLLNDPCHNPNLSLAAGEFVLRGAPRDAAARSSEC
ncbi:glycosyltransferase family 2 protein [Rhizobium paknamense]|uniref:GT2 family glycosyltransferase n=1 Tax=Rhizobium paknamense TaxID=1206817 RepID=A0ABU0I7G7_9HYPH|nr:glycosyltransferase family 2 protein [Rhizobium paknamense]MDQ0454168.1 GT2 family glycosyltransferase [Rhizobium paknamense]